MAFGLKEKSFNRKRVESNFVQLQTKYVEIYLKFEKKIPVGDFSQKNSRSNCT